MKTDEFQRIVLKKSLESNYEKFQQQIQNMRYFSIFFVVESSSFKKLNNI